jgi:hypothetical protein
MRVWLVIAGMLASLALAEPARATPGLPGPPAVASATERAPRVQRERANWACTRVACTPAASSSWSAALGFAATTLAAAGISRRRSPASR